jgi:uncharacterized membrane protein YvbJ
MAEGKGRCDCLLDRWMLQCAQCKKKENSRREEPKKEGTRSIRTDREWGKGRRVVVVLNFSCCIIISYIYFFISYW